MPRVYKRKFDWAEVARRYVAGETLQEIANDVGVSVAAVRYAVNPEAYVEMGRKREEWAKGGVCEECGGPMNRTSRSGSDRTKRSTRCRRCANAARRTTVRPDGLLCQSCREWKPDWEFSPDDSEPARRGRRARCQECENLKRRLRRRKVGTVCAFCGVKTTGPERCRSCWHKRLGADRRSRA